LRAPARGHQPCLRLRSGVVTRRPAGAILMALSIVAGACSPSGGEPAAVPVDPCTYLHAITGVYSHTRHI